MTLPAPPHDYRGAFRTDDDARAVYAEAAGIARVTPAAVARPDDAASVVALVRWAATHRVALVPRGSGSSMAGGAIGDGVVLDLGALTAMGPVDPATRTIHVEAGAVRDTVDAAARVHRLRFSVDPSSGAFCTIGGMIGTNAAGAHAMSAGAMRAHVVALDGVFADGTRATVSRDAAMPRVAALDRLAAAQPDLAVLAAGGIARADVRKESSGYAVGSYLAGGNALDLLVGSEGTLAVVLGATLRLEPVPADTRTLLAAFGSLDDAVSAAEHVRACDAAACELLDRTFLDVARAGGHGMSIPPDAEAVLLVEAESASAELGDGCQAALHATLLAHGAVLVVTAAEPVAQAELWELRHAASPTIARLHPMLRSMQFIEDGAVPPARFAEYVRGVRAILARHDVPGVIFGHAGDSHAHVNPLLDVSRPAWRTQLEGVLADTTALVARLGGTIAAEHGDGRLRTPLLAEVWPDHARRAFALVKHAFDPAGILNPGVKVPLAGQRAIDLVKYDPSLPPLPPRAARALAHVAHTKGYAASRLALLDGEI